MNSQDLHNLQEAYMEVAMNEGKQKYPYAKVTDQLRNKEGDAYRTSKTNPKEGERKEKEHLRHQKIHDRVKNLPYHEIGRTENRLKDSEKDNKPQKYFPNRLRRADGQGIKDSYEYDLYDIILSHLLDEGYADTEQAAEAIMVNMSEDWRESIMEAMKPLPVGKMIKQAARHSNPEQVAKMAKVADTHNPNKSKRKEDDNRREGGRKREAGRPRRNELQDNW
jgi:hypothetical protein